MINKITMLFLILVILVPSAFALDLNEFPNMFIKDGSINALVIVGKAAKAEDVLGAIDIVVMLQNKAGNKKLDIARLDSEVETLSTQNTIIVGGPCANSAAAKLMGYPKNCLEGFEMGKSIIRLYQFENGKIAMLVAGTVALDTRRATYVLANYQDYNLSGTNMIISGVNLNDVTISPIK